MSQVAATPLHVKVVLVPDLFRRQSKSVVWLNWSPDFTLEKAIPQEWPRDQVKIRCDGIAVPKEDWDSFSVNPGSEIVAVVDPLGVETALLSIGLTAWLAATTAFVINMALAVGLGLLAQKLLGPPEEANLGNSPTYTFGSLQMTTRNGQPLPIVYGEHTISGQVLQVVPKVNDEGESSIRMLVGLGEGPIQAIAGLTTDKNALSGTDIPTGIKINGNPARDLQNVLVWTRLGNRIQEVVPGFQDTVLPADINVELEYLVENTYTTSIAVESFEVELYFPLGTYERDRKGKIHHTEISYQISWGPTGSYTETETITFSSRRTSPYSAIYRNDNPGITNGNEAQIIDIKVVRLNDPSDYRHFRDITWVRVNEINLGTSISYPHTALIALEIPAQDQASGGLPNVTTDVIGKKLYTWNTADLNPQTTTLTFEYSNNPAHVLFDFLLNPRYGGGHIFTLCDIDLTSFDAWRAYCIEQVDDLTNTSTFINRWEVDYVIDTLSGFWDVVTHLGSLGRAQILLVGSKVKVKIERAANPVQLFTVGNILRDSLRIQYTALEDRENYVEIQYLNEDRNYEHDIASLEDRERLNDPNEKTFVKSLELYGVTKAGRAYRAAQFLLNAARLLLRSIEFNSPIDAVAIEPGDVFQFQHNLPDWNSSVGGRTLAASGVATITLDQDITIGSGETWYVWVRTSTLGADDIQSRLIVESPGTYTAGTELTVATDWETGDRPARGDIYAAVNVSGTQTIMEFRALEVELQQDLTVRISGLEYNEDVYDDTPDYVVDNDVEDPIDRNTIPDNPTQLIITEEDGPNLVISWTPATWPWRYGFNVWLRNQTNGQGSFGLVGTTDSRSPSFTYPDAELGSTYVISISPCSANGSACRSPDNGLIGQYTVTGEVPPPDDITGLTVTQNNTTVSLSWTGIDTDANKLDFYEVWRGRSWYNRRVIATTTATSLVTSDWVIGTDYFGVRVKSLAGFYSESPPINSLTLALPSGESSDVSRDEVSLTWPGTKTNVTVNSDGYLELSSSQATGTYESPTITIGSNASRRVGVLIQTEQIDAAVTWDSLDDTWDSKTENWEDNTELWGDGSPTWETTNPAKRRDWEGLMVDPATSVGIQIALDTGSGFGNYQDFSPGFYTCANLKFKLTLARDSVTDDQVIVDVCQVSVSSNPSALLGGGLVGNHITVNSATTTVKTLSAGDFESVILVNAATASVTVNLPVASTMDNRVVYVKKVDSTVNTVVIDPSGSETIDDESTVTLEVEGEAIMLYCDGTEWHVL